MPSFTYVHIVDFQNKVSKHTFFRKMSDAISYVKSFPCKGHIVYAVRYDELLAMKSDVKFDTNFQFYERISKGKVCDIDVNLKHNVSKADSDSKSQLWYCSVRP